MSGPRFTPGPWRAERVFGAACDAYQIRTDKNEIARIVAPAAKKPTALPNALLIAAAPELYEALREVLDDAYSGNGLCAPTWDTVERARAVLAKVDGAEATR